MGARQPRTDIAAVTTPRASSDPIEDELRAARGEPRTFSSAPHGFKCKMRRVSRVHARVVHYCSSVASRTRDRSRPRNAGERGGCSVATESEYIGLKASRRSVTYTHLTARTHSSSRERTRTYLVCARGRSRTHGDRPSRFVAPWRQARNRARCVHLRARTPPPRLCAYAGCGACTHLSACTHPTLRTRREPTNVMAGVGEGGGGGTGQHGVSCPLARVHATSPGRPSQHNQSTAKL